MSEPFPPRRFTYEQRAERHNKRTAQRFPLFAAAGVLEQVAQPWTAQTVVDIELELADRLTAGRREQYRRGAFYRQQMASRMTPEELRERDRYFARVYPHKGEYFAGYWREISLGKR